MGCEDAPGCDASCGKMKEICWNGCERRSLSPDTEAGDDDDDEDVFGWDVKKLHDS
jgi:hypothetical protein